MKASSSYSLIQLTYTSFAAVIVILIALPTLAEAMQVNTKKLYDALLLSVSCIYSALSLACITFFYLQERYLLNRKDEEIVRAFVLMMVELLFASWCTYILAPKVLTFHEEAFFFVALTSIFSVLGGGVAFLFIKFIRHTTLQVESEEVHS